MCYELAALTGFEYQNNDDLIEKSYTGCYLDRLCDLSEQIFVNWIGFKFHKYLWCQTHLFED